ncbi:MAG: hypothetical protein HYZ11_18375 [Candidatus Tectomicrobia bacterium]|uniref:Uncharacterized protein n=1 Tax=Tectimicrobiota bacterium TaxID=2528274 RepID=A0A932MNP7_UNCTE|nr:hypothetical protein [Candidatus Tectomicrobia bacterium]
MTGAVAGGASLSGLRRHPTVRFLFVCLVIIALYVGYGYATASGRLTSRLGERLARNPATLDILVTTPFPPEEFHIRIYQKIGNMRGVEGNSAKLYTVSASNVRYLSRYYWVQRLDLIPEEKP